MRDAGRIAISESAVGALLAGAAARPKPGVLATLWLGALIALVVSVDWLAGHRHYMATAGLQLCRPWS